MKKITFLMAAVALLMFLSIPTGMKGQTRDVEAFTFSELGYSNADDVTIVEGDNVTLTFDQGTNANNAPKYYSNGTAVRMYTGNTLEVALNNQEGETRITAIDFTFTGSYTGSLQNWTGSATSVSFTNTASSQARIQELAVTFSEGGIAPTTYTVTYKANGVNVADVVDIYTEGADVTLRPANTFTYEGHIFSEWNTDAVGDGDAYEAGETINNIQTNLELYAIWIEDITPSDEQWVLTNLADLTSSDVFVIVGNGYAMTNNNGTSSAPAPVAVTISGNEITSTVNANIQWTVTGDATNGYSFSPNGSTDTWLYCNTNASTSSNNNMRVGDGGQYNRIVFELNSNNYLLTKDEYTTRYLSIYINSGVPQDWRGYTNTNLCPVMSFYKKVTGGVIPPSISADNVSIEYNAVSGSIAYTINNGVEDGTVSATVTEGDWLTLGQGTTSPISFTCTANAAGTERTATVTLTYSYNNRATATANVTVTQAGNPDVVNNISDITATGIDYAIIGTVVAKSARGLVFGDGTGYVYYYNPSYTQADYNIGDIKKVSGTMGYYNHVFQFTSTATIEAAESSNYNNTPAIQVLDANGIAAYNNDLHLSDYVQIEGTLVKSGSYYNLEVAGLETTASISYPTTAQAEELDALQNKVIIVKGYFAGVSSGHFNVVMGSVEEVVSTEPSITVNPATINAPVEGADGTLAITYENIPDLISFDIQFCDANGDELEGDDPEWIYAEITEPSGEEGYTVSYIIDANDGDARTAYFKVYTFVGEELEEVYSNLITVSQVEYVAPTFAELPFEFDGGKAAIENTDGLYQEGLGSDYNNSPKLKFDGDNDYLLLQFNEVPGKLTFNIKGNPSAGVWAGTFKVQTSEDGTTYTDLATYTDLPATVQSEEFTNLGENVRYIKWIYVEKVSGNVALGNIVLLQPSILETYDLTVEPFENLEIFTFVENDDEVALVGAGTIQVTEGDQVMLSVTANEGYVIQSLMVDGEEHVNDIDDEETYLFNMPSHNVTISATAVEVIPFEPATYTLVNRIDEIVSGKTYIIVGSKTIDEEINYFAMGEQRNNNRGGVAISVDGTTAMVETPEVHEFIINDTLLSDVIDKDGGTWIGVPFYSIYDTNENDQGFLYAASSTGNQLKTESELDENGLWNIDIDSTGQFSIIAQGSNTRNVMQFNYNNGNTLFACYATASQSPVYLYVKDEVPSTFTQTVVLSEGWNWWSTYIDGEDMLDQLKACLGTVGVSVRTQGASMIYRGGRWMGSVPMENSRGYQIMVNAPVEVTMEGQIVDPTTCPITILPGANWIGYPLTESQTVGAALAGFTPNNGDAISTQGGSVLYRSGRWMPASFTFEPGKSYVYKSTSTETKTLVFSNGKKAMSYQGKKVSSKIQQKATLNAKSLKVSTIK